MILFKTALPISGREDVWASEVLVKTLLPARRDKLVTLCNLVGFVLRDNNGTAVKDELVSDGGLYLMESG